MRFVHVIYAYRAVQKICVTMKKRKLHRQVFCILLRHYFVDQTVLCSRSMEYFASFSSSAFPTLFFLLHFFLSFGLSSSTPHTFFPLLYPSPLPFMV